MGIAYRCIQVAEVSQHLRKLDALHHYYGCLVRSWDGPSRVFAIIQSSWENKVVETITLERVEVATGDGVGVSRSGRMATALVVGCVV